MLTVRALAGKLCCWTLWNRGRKQPRLLPRRLPCGVLVCGGQRTPALWTRKLLPSGIHRSFSLSCGCRMCLSTMLTSGQADSDRPLISLTRTALDPAKLDRMEVSPPSRTRRVTVRVEKVSSPALQLLMTVTGFFCPVGSTRIDQQICPSGHYCPMACHIVGRRSDFFI